MKLQPWRTCAHCGRAYQTRTDLFDLYVAYALTINPQAVIDVNDPLDFCAACGEDFEGEREEQES